jgi:hypothetical protein
MKDRVVHLELVPDLSILAFINCLARFVDTRPGPVEEIFSDNGSNFRGAERELGKAVKQLNDAIATSKFEGRKLLKDKVVFPTSCSSKLGLSI